MGGGDKHPVPGEKGYQALSRRGKVFEERQLSVFKWINPASSPRGLQEKCVKIRKRTIHCGEHAIP